MKAKNNKTKNWSLIIGLSIPFLMMLFIAASIYLPRLLDNTPPPEINFIYSTSNRYPSRIEVRDNTLVWEKNYPQTSRENDAKLKPPKIYLHDVKTNKNKELTLEQAQELLLNSQQESPDGYKVERSRSSGLFFFGRRSGREYYLVNDYSSHKLKLEFDSGNYYSFQFLAWVLEE